MRLATIIPFSTAINAECRHVGSLETTEPMRPMSHRWLPVGLYLQFSRTNRRGLRLINSLPVLRAGHLPRKQTPQLPGQRRRPPAHRCQLSSTPRCHLALGQHTAWCNNSRRPCHCPSSRPWCAPPFTAAASIHAL